MIETLAKREMLNAKHNDHPLKGEYRNCRECHIIPDWLLIYEKMEDTLILYLTRTGTHSDLFE
jgi:addiction module toxin, RelE/StbE family